MSSLRFTKTFTAELVRHGSWGGNNIGMYESTMDLYLPEAMPTNGFIEWDIPDLEETESIGLFFDIEAGVRILCDYDGIMALPHEAVELMREAGIIVLPEFED